MTDMDYAARMKATGRNDTCPCGSGKKYKRCHLAEDQGKRSAELAALAEAAKAAAEAAAAEDSEDDGKTDAKGGDKSKPAAKRSKDKPGSRGQAAAGKAKNMPRRSAV